MEKFRELLSELRAEPDALTPEETEEVEFDWKVLVSLLVAAAGAISSGAAPTGDRLVDLGLSAFLSCFVVWLAVGLAQQYLVLPMLVIGLATMSPFWIAAVFLAVVLLFNERAASWLGARGGTGFSAAIGVSALWRLSDVGFFGLPTLLALAAVAPIVLQPLLNRTPSQKRATWTWAVPLTIVLFGYGVSVAAMTQSVQLDINNAVTSLEAAAQAAADGESADMVADLERSHRAFLSAERRLGSTTARVGRLIPGLAQQIRATDVVVAQAVVLSGTARETGPLIYPDVIYAEGGWIAFDLLERTSRGLAAFDDVVANSIVTIDDVPRNWLLPPIASALDGAGDQLRDLAANLDTAERGFATMPAILGADEEQRILVLLTTPAETRERGGFVGAYALLSASRQGLEIIDSGPVQELRQEVQQFTDPSEFSSWFLRYDHARYPQNVTAAPSLTTTYDAVQQLFPTLRGAPVDTVAYIDPAGMSAFVESVGSIRLPGSGRVLNADEAVDFLLREQYVYWSDPNRQSALLSQLFESVFLEFLATGLPAPGNAEAIFGDEVRGGHIAVATGDRKANEFLADVSMQREFPGDIESDFISVVQVNAAPSKLDAYLRRSVDYQASVDPASGVIQGTVTVDLLSAAPSDLPDYVVAGGRDDNDGERPEGHEILLSIYTPHLVTAASVDGRAAELVVFEEYGLNRAMVRVGIGLGAASKVRFSFFGEVPTGGYGLKVMRQPLAFPDQMNVDVFGIGGWSLVADMTSVEALPPAPSNLASAMLLADDEADLAPGSGAADGVGERGGRSLLSGASAFETSGDDVDSGLVFSLTADLELRYAAIAEDL